jgi:TetR/AcrR family transcriptional regulator
MKTSSPSADLTVPSREPRKRQTRSDETRTALLDAALVEFSAHGFEGASTRAIAAHAGTHQPQINYHFASKEALWRESVDHLFGRLDALIDAHTDGLSFQLQTKPRRSATPTRESAVMRAEFALLVGGFVRAVAQLPELNRIMVQEATIDSDRLEWIVKRHTRSRYQALVGLWRNLRDAGEAHEIDDTVFYYSLIGAASLPYVNSPEARHLGHNTTSERFISAHINALLLMFLKETNHA